MHRRERVKTQLFILVVEFKYILLVWKLFCDVQKRRYGRGVVADAKRRGANGSKCRSIFFLSPVWFLWPYAPYPRLPKNYLELCPKRLGPSTILCVVCIHAYCVGLTSWKCSRFNLFSDLSIYLFILYCIFKQFNNDWNINRSFFREKEDV